MITKFNKFINESMFGNGIYEGPFIPIPDDLAFWCMNFYSVQNNTIYDFTKIPKNIIIASKKLLKSYGNDVIYRGFGIEDKLPNELIFSLNKKSISWTFDEETARVFSEKYENMGINPFIAELNYNKLKYIISMDVIMENITSRQVKMLTNTKTLRDIENYVSESEILVFDTVKINKNDIKPLWEN